MSQRFIHNFMRIFYLVLYVIGFLTSVASLYTAAWLYSRGGNVITTNIVLWACGGALLMLISVLFYRIYLKLAKDGGKTEDDLL